MISNRTDVKKLENSIKNLTDLYSDLLPQKISRLRRLFLKYMSRDIVDKYYMPRTIEGINISKRKIFLESTKIILPKTLSSIKQKHIKIDDNDNDYINNPKNTNPSELNFDDVAPRNDIYILS
ncbi:MAG: hypothetical protein MJ211_16070 [Bacteroidales bacterium]|nr:hypothetical protein [Bacteroidales bacterium]